MSQARTRWTTTTRAPDSEDEVFWRAFLIGLKKRGLVGVQLVISDQHAGLVAALTRVFQGSSHQRCRVHFIRNVLAHVPKAETDADGDEHEGDPVHRGEAA